MAENFDIVVFGGSFDPPHAGHEKMARLALARASHLMFMPAHRSPLKYAQPARFEQRVKMLEIVCERLAKNGLSVSVADMEGKRPPPSYTIESLRAIQSQNPGLHISLLVGSDSLADFASWKDPEAIAREFDLMVAYRITDQQAESSIRKVESEFKARITALPGEIPGCASRDLRRWIRSEASGLEKEGGEESLLKDCMARDVLDYIRAQGLYLNVSN